MDGFIGFTDVQIASAVCFTLFWGGVMSGVLFSGVPYYLIKWLIKRFKEKE